MRRRFTIRQIEDADGQSVALHLQNGTTGTDFRVVWVRGDDQDIKHFFASLILARHLFRGGRCPVVG